MFFMCKLYVNDSLQLLNLPVLVDAVIGQGIRAKVFKDCWECWQLMALSCIPSGELPLLEGSCLTQGYASSPWQPTSNDWSVKGIQKPSPLASIWDNSERPSQLQSSVFSSTPSSFP